MKKCRVKYIFCVGLLGVGTNVFCDEINKVNLTTVNKEHIISFEVSKAQLLFGGKITDQHLDADLLTKDRKRIVGIACGKIGSESQNWISILPKRPSGKSLSEITEYIFPAEQDCREFLRSAIDVDDSKTLEVEIKKTADQLTLTYRRRNKI